MSEEQNKGKKRIKKRTILGAILIVMSACALMIVFLLLFQVRQMEVEGNRYLTTQEVADWMCQDDLSSNSVYLMWKYHFSDYELLPAIEEVKVGMKNPWTMKVTVKEKRIVGYIVLNDDFVYFDKDGIVLAKTREWWDDVACIEGLSVKEVKLFEELPVSRANKKAFQQLLDMSASLKKYDLKPERITCVGSDIYLYFGKVCVIVGDENLPDRIAQITPILEKLGDEKGTLHLENYGENNTTSSFEKGVLPPEPEADTEADKENDQKEADQKEADQKETDSSKKEADSSDKEAEKNTGGE